jgi:hypothetical protein
MSEEIGKHWAESLEVGDRCIGTLRHTTDGSKNVKGAKLIVVENNLIERFVQGAIGNHVWKVPYNELSRIDNEG